jgi:hypothetical protein
MQRVHRKGKKKTSTLAALALHSPKIALSLSFSSTYYSSISSIKAQKWQSQNTDTNQNASFIEELRATIKAVQWNFATSNNDHMHI